ncbi:type II toxin-antitoxin system PemK/MazF family toxin [bacterium]|nr:type II toxin-antitoxin system PemK/MazF family toxin [bacterium]
MTKGKIVLVPFPFDDISTVKVRPAVCLTDPIGEYSHIILAFISSRIPHVLLESDIVIDQKHIDFDISGLHVTSALRLHRLITVSSSIVRRELGLISGRIQKEIDGKLHKLFGL